MPGKRSAVGLNERDCGARSEIGKVEKTWSPAGTNGVKARFWEGRGHHQRESRVNSGDTPREQTFRSGF